MDPTLGDVECFALNRRLALPFGLQIAKQAVESLLVGVVIPPVGKVGDEVLADLAGAVKLPVLNPVERHNGDGKEHLTMLLVLPRSGIGDFIFYPSAVHAGVGQNKQKLVVQANRLLNLIVYLPPTPDVVGRKPAPDTAVLQVGVEAFCYSLVFGRIADEARKELGAFVEERREILNE